MANYLTINMTQGPKALTGEPQNIQEQPLLEAV